MNPLEKPPSKKSSNLSNKMEVVVPAFNNLDDVLYPFADDIFDKRGTVVIKSGKKVIKQFEIRPDATKNKFYRHFRPAFFESGSESNLLVEEGMKIIFKPFKEVRARKLVQKFREGINHCVFTPLHSLWNQNPSSIQETLLKRVIKYANKYGDNPVPQDEMEQLAKSLRTTIKINDPIGKPYITYNPSGDRTCVLMNPRKNHVEETLDEKEILEISHQEAVNYLENLKDGEVLEGTFQDPIKIHTYTNVLEVKNPMKSFINEIHSLIPDIKFDASQYPEINQYILESRIINSGTLRFQEEYDEHYDLEKAYTQFHLTKYYQGFLGVIHQWRNFTFPPTASFLKEHIGIYKAKIINPSKLGKILGFEAGQYYILPSPEWEFHKNNNTTFTIVSGVWGSNFDFRFPDSSFQNVPLRTYDPNLPKTTNKPYRIFSGQLSSKIDENDCKLYNVRATQEFTEHLKTLYPDTLYDPETNSAKIYIKHKKVYTKHHLLSFITSYTRIVMMEEMLKFDISNLSGLTLDGLYFKGKAPKNLIPQFRPKPSKMPISESTNWYIPSNNTTVFPLLSAFNQNTFLEGAGGSGKTHTILSDKGFNNILYAAPTRDLGKEKAIEYNLKYHTTVHKLAGINASNKPSRTYEEEFHHTPSVIFIDELTQIEAYFIEKIISLYPNSLIFIAGDVDGEGRHFQCKYSNQIWKPTFPIIQFNEDYRAKTNTLKQMKQALRNYMKTDPTAYEIKEYVKLNYPLTKKETAIANFTEQDVWIAGTHKYIKTLHPLKIHTTHSYQGKTISSPTKLYISIDDMFEHTMFYTAMSRVQSDQQLIIVEG